MKTLHGIAVAVLTSTLVACALDSVDRGGNITIRLSPPQKNGSSLNSLRGGINKGLTAPTSIAQFSCIGVNVTGPGIPDSSTNPKPDLGPLFDRLLRKESYCTYRGILKGPLLANSTADQEVSLVIPPGAPRLIQIVGLIERNGSIDCQAEFNQGIPRPMVSGTSAEADAYELGRAVVDLYQDQTVSIAMDYGQLASADQALRDVKCKASPIPGASGAPAPIMSPYPLVMPSSSPSYIATGVNHVCGIFGGTVYCRGANMSGQLGDGTYINRSSFVATSVTSATQLALGDGFSCALASGSVKCWGAGINGQLGNGGSANSNVPVTVSGGLTSVSKIAAGASHACALTTSGVSCWGLNASGQLGNGNTTNQYAPVSVTGSVSGATSVSAGFAHTCVGTSIDVKCWGRNDVGQVGIGSTSPPVIASPTPVVSLGYAMSLVAGADHNCAISSSSLSCWGNNASGQIGVGGNVVSPISSPTPVPVGSSLPVYGVGTGKGFTCARTSTGALYCWGVGPLLGNNTPTGSSTPVANTTLTSGVNDIYSCSVSGTVCVGLTTGEVLCWGDNSFNQISP